jgi:hypothetical protein
VAAAKAKALAAGVPSGDRAGNHRLSSVRNQRVRSPVLCRRKPRYKRVSAPQPKPWVARPAPVAAASPRVAPMPVDTGSTYN